MAKQYIDLADLTLFKSLYDVEIGNKIDTAEAKSLHTVTITGNTLKFYKDEEPLSDDATPAYSITLPSFDPTEINEAIQGLEDLIGDIPAGATAETVIGYVQEYVDAKKAADIEYKAATEGKAAVSVKGALDDLYTQIGSGGSVDTQITEAIEALDSSIDEESNKVISAFEIEDGKIKAASTKKITLTDVATTGAAADVSIADAGSLITATNVEDAMQELATAIADSTDGGKVTVETPTSSDYAAVYKFYQGVLDTDDAAAKEAKLLTTVNIPKDLVVKAGKVVTVSEGSDSDGEATTVADGTYVKLTIQNQTEKLYINVADLVDVYTGVTGTEATVTVSATNEIGVTINKVSATKIVYTEADTEKGTAEVTVKAAIDDLYTQIGSGGSVDSQIDAKIAELDSSIAEEANKVITAFEIEDGKIKAASTKKIELGSAALTASTDYATAAQGALADTALQSADVESVPEASIRALFS